MLYLDGHVRINIGGSPISCR